MKNNNNTVESLLNEFINRNVDRREVNMKLGIVTSVDKDNYTYAFKPNDSSPEVEVNMTAIGSDKSSYVAVPKVDTQAIVDFTNVNDLYTIIIEETEQIIYNGGSNEGLININELTEKLNQTVDELNSAIDKYNKHQNVIPAGTVLVGAQGGVSNPAPILLDIKTTDNAQDATKYKKEDYEDDSIIH